MNYLTQFVLCHVEKNENHFGILLVIFLPPGKVCMYDLYAILLLHESIEQVNEFIRLT